MMEKERRRSNSMYTVCLTVSKPCKRWSRCLPCVCVCVGADRVCWTLWKKGVRGSSWSLFWLLAVAPQLKKREDAERAPFHKSGKMHLFFFFSSLVGQDTHTHNSAMTFLSKYNVNKLAHAFVRSVRMTTNLFGAQRAKFRKKGAKRRISTKKVYFPSFSHLICI